MNKNRSAIKKTQTSLRNSLHNKRYKSSIKTRIKKFILSLDNDKDCSLFNLSAAYSIIDKAVKNKILHKNKGARKKALLIKILRKTESI